jgi:hypothetical protein
MVLQKIMESDPIICTLFANVKAVSNSVLAALHTGGRMRVYAKNKSVGAPNCVVKYMHALPA